MRRNPGLTLGLVSLAFLTFGTLVFTEVIRPFRDSHIDMPLAVIAGVISVIVSSGALHFRKGATWLNALVLLFGLLGLFFVAWIVQALSHMRLF